MGPCGMTGKHDVRDALIHHDSAVHAHMIFNELATCRITRKKPHIWLSLPDFRSMRCRNRRIGRTYEVTTVHTVEVQSHRFTERFPSAKKSCCCKLIPR